MIKSPIRNLRSERIISPRFCDVIIDNGKIFLDKKTDKINMNENIKRNLNEQVANKSNKLLYGFIGGITLTYIVDCLYHYTTSADALKYGSMSIMKILVLSIILLMFFSIAVKKIYNFNLTHFFISSETRKLRKVTLFNDYLYAKNMEILKEGHLNKKRTPTHSNLIHISLKIRH